MQQRSGSVVAAAATTTAGAAVGQATTTRRRCEGTAMGSITLDLRPGLGIGPFTLGMPVREAFIQTEHQPNIYDVVHIKYLDEPLKLDTVITFPDHGFHLRFDPWSQEILGDGGRAAIQTQGFMNNPFGSTFVYGYQNVAFEEGCIRAGAGCMMLFFIHH